MPIPGRDPSLYDGTDGKIGLGTADITLSISDSDLGSGEFYKDAKYDIGVYLKYNSFTGADTEEKLKYNLKPRFYFASSSSTNLQLKRVTFYMQAADTPASTYKLTVSNQTMPTITITDDNGSSTTRSITSSGYISLSTSSYNFPWYSADINKNINISSNYNYVNINLSISLINYRLKRSDGLESQFETKIYDVSNNNEISRLDTRINISHSGTPATPDSCTVAFYDAKGDLIKSGTVYADNYFIDHIPDYFIDTPGGVAIPQQKESTTATATRYNVNFYADKSCTIPVGNSVPLTGTGGTINYVQASVNVSCKSKGHSMHYLWSTTPGGSGIYEIILSKGSYKFYPVFKSQTDGGSPPQNLPPSFPSTTKFGYRSPNGNKNNNSYYTKNNDPVIPGGGIPSDSISGNNINLHLEWEPVKYTIRFNKGSGDGWFSSVNTLTTLTKTFDTDIKTTDSEYPNNDTRLVKDGYLQYGWINNGSSIHNKNDTSICTYSYVDSEGRYNFVKQNITDKWYSDNMSGVDVYPCWEPIKHKILAHYYVKNGGAQKTDTYKFSLDDPHLSVGAPKEVSDKSKAWIFLGWVQNEVPSGTYTHGSTTGTWEWGAGGGNIRNYGAFRFIKDIKDIKYSSTYGVNSNSLTKSDWNDINKNIHLYGLWAINSKFVQINNSWKPMLGMWVCIDGVWKEVDVVYNYKDAWKSEIVE